MPLCYNKVTKGLSVCEYIERKNKSLFICKIRCISFVRFRFSTNICCTFHFVIVLLKINILRKMKLWFCRQLSWISTGNIRQLRRYRDIRRWQQHNGTNNFHVINKWPNNNNNNNAGWYTVLLHWYPNVWRTKPGRWALLQRALSKVHSLLHTNAL